MRDETHILLVIWHPVGGIRTFLRYVYGQFSPEQYQLTLLLPETSELAATREDLACTDAHFEVIPNKPSIYSFLIQINSLLQRRDIDIVHSQGFTSGVLAAIPARLRRIPHILTSHDVLREDQFIGLSGKIKKIILSYLLSIPDIIHSVSNDAQGNLLEFFPRLKGRPGKYCVIHNGIEPQRFLAEERADLKGSMGMAKEAFLIGFFGRFMPQKGFDILIDAVEKLVRKKDLPNFAVVAFGWSGFIREEQESIEQRGLSKYFFFLPFEPNVAKVLRGVDVVAMPSRWEACPLLPMEALVAGIPIIGTDCLGLQEVLKGTPGKIIPSDNAEDLAQALLAEMQSSSVKEIAEFRDEAAVRFDVDRQVEGVKKIISDLVGSRDD